ncbi:hypothetical protein TNCT_677231 [Trichonephila clavata]|uniref:Uncharacterized protein n=1 Tax=Trichonephila clavata TaxID=2740835 RepID=A0A8X6LWE5_TRICU|nr:hypothetical protein TNCT_677231 [Trichonephila clavata]
MPIFDQQELPGDRASSRLDILHVSVLAEPPNSWNEEDPPFKGRCILLRNAFTDFESTQFAFERVQECEMEDLKANKLNSNQRCALQ